MCAKPIVKVNVSRNHPIKQDKVARVSQKQPIRHSFNHASKGVSVVTVTNRPAFMFKVYENFLRQNYRPRELIVILNSNTMILEHWLENAPPHESVKIFQLDETVSLGECYNYAVAQASFPCIAKFDDDDYYASDFIRSGMATLSNIDAHIIGKSCRYIYFESSSTLALYEACPEHSYVDYVPGATMIIKKEVFDLVGFPDMNEGEDSEFQEECIRKGFLIYAGDRFNYVTIRRKDGHTHTFKIDDQTYMEYCQDLTVIKDFRPLISRSRRYKISLQRSHAKNAGE